MANAFDIAKEYFPEGESTEMLEGVIWGLTGFPSFWRIGVDGSTPEECFRLQIARAVHQLDRCIDPHQIEMEKMSELLINDRR